MRVGSDRPFAVLTSLGYGAPLLRSIGERRERLDTARVDEARRARIEADAKAGEGSTKSPGGATGRGNRGVGTGGGDARGSGRDGITVISAFEGYAFDAGMRAGDRITAINGQPVAGISVEKVRHKGSFELLLRLGPTGFPSVRMLLFVGRR